MLTEMQLADLTNQLQAPVIVSDIINNQEVLDDEAQLGLHEILSNLQPDSALLAIALSARKIAGAYSCASAGIKILDRECGKIINDYAELWLQHANGKKIDETHAFDTLEHIAEDLEGMASLLKLSIPFLQTKDETAASLFKLLRIQAGAQAMIAETLLGALSTEIYEESLSPQAIKTLTTSSNIVIFPSLNTNIAS